MDVRPLVGLFVLPSRTPGPAHPIGCKILGCPELGGVGMSVCCLCCLCCICSRARGSAERSTKCAGLALCHRHICLLELLLNFQKTCRGGISLRVRGLPATLQPN